MTTPYHDTPSWVADAVFYQIFPDRFARSDRVTKERNLEAWEAPPTRHGFKGGDLGGVIEHLDHLTELGVNAILFNPIFQSASNHRYHAHDYYRIDPLLGDEALFDELVAACHARGIRVVLDGVFNHCSRGFFQFNDVLENGDQSPYVDWFRIKGFPIYPYHPSQQGDPMYDAWFGLPALPVFNTDNASVRQYLFEVAEHWTRKGIDGWRLDVPLEIKTPGFWEEFRRRVRAINPDAYIVAEIWHDAAEWLNDRERFDGTMNYLYTGHVIAFTGGGRVDPSTIVHHEAWPVTQPVDASAFAGAVHHILGLYSDQATLGNLNCFSSHDTARLLTIMSDDEAATRLTALLAMTFPGPAHLYYGEELGMKGHRDPLSRGAILWDGPEDWNHDMLATFRQLIALRKAHPSLRGLAYRTIVADGMVYAAQRGDDEDRLIVAANAGEETVTIDVGAGDDATVLWGAADVSGSSITLPPRAGAVIDG
jgi:glycosidase